MVAAADVRDRVEVKLYSSLGVIHDVLVRLPMSFSMEQELQSADAFVRSRVPLTYSLEDCSSRHIIEYLAGLQAYLNGMTPQPAMPQDSESMITLLDLCILEHFDLLDALNQFAHPDNQPTLIWLQSVDSHQMTPFFLALLSSCNQCLSSIRILLSNAYSEQAVILFRAYVERVTAVMTLLIDPEFFADLVHKESDRKKALSHWFANLSMKQLQKRLRAFHSKAREDGYPTMLRPVMRDIEDGFYGYLSEYTHGAIGAVLSERRAGEGVSFGNIPTGASDSLPFIQNLIGYSYSAVMLIQHYLWTHNQGNPWLDVHVQGRDFLSYKTDVLCEVYGASIKSFSILNRHQQ